MDANLTQIIVTVIVALGGFLTAKYSKRDVKVETEKDDDDRTIELLEKRIAELEKELRECHAVKQEDRARYFEALSAMGQRMKKGAIPTRSRTKRPPK